MSTPSTYTPMEEEDDDDDSSSWSESKVATKSVIPSTTPTGAGTKLETGATTLGAVATLYIVDNWITPLSDQIFLMAILAFSLSLVMSVVESALLGAATAGHREPLRLHNLKWLVHIAHGICFYGSLILLLKAGTPLVVVNRSSALVVVVMLVVTAGVVFFTLASPFVGVLTVSSDPRRVVGALQRRRPMR